MGLLMQYSNPIGGTFDEASHIRYDNTTSGSEETDVQGELDKLEGDLSEFEDNISASWQPITITGSYSGALIALYHPTLKLAMLSYNSNTTTGTYNLTMDVNPAIRIIYGTLEGNGRISIFANGSLTIEAPVNYSTGQVIFPIA